MRKDNWIRQKNEGQTTLTVEMFLAMPFFAGAHRQSTNPDGYVSFLKKMIALERSLLNNISYYVQFHESHSLFKCNNYISILFKEK